MFQFRNTSSLGRERRVVCHRLLSSAGVSGRTARMHCSQRNGARASNRSDRGKHRRSGLILLVVLIMVALLSLLAAVFSFTVRSNLATVQAHHREFQARMAAESGIQRAILALRNSRGNVDSWANDPASYRGGLVYGIQEGFDDSPAFRNQTNATTFDRNAPEAWRFSLVAPSDVQGTVRYGITDEGARLNLNLASETELKRLFTAVIPSSLENPVDIDALVDCLLDWRSPGDQQRPKGAKSPYYLSLTPAYRCKSAPFSTIEELLLVKGFTGWIVFGEDYNQNGLLDPNENDSDESFPPDNGDGTLFRGISAYLTLWSREMNMSGDGRQKINLNKQDVQKLQDELSAEFDGSIVSYVMQVRGSGRTFNSVMNLFPAPPPPEQPEEEAPPEEDPPPVDEPPATTQESGEGEAAEPALNQVKEDAEKLATEAAQAVEKSEPNGRSENRRAPNRRPTQRPSSAPKLPVYQDVAPDPPGTLETLPQILDRLTVNQTPVTQGRINVNTAPREVLLTLEVLTEDDVTAIVAARAELKPEEKATPAWLLSKGTIDLYKFRRIFDKITTGGSVFRAEAVGYADHTGVVQRINTVFEMRGPIPQVLYTRNLTSLGPAYNPYGEERRGGTIQTGR